STCGIESAARSGWHSGAHSIISTGWWNTRGSLAWNSAWTVSSDVAVNRQAFHNYEIIEKFEAGIMLTGTEIKSARDGKVNLKDSYGMVKAGEVWLLNCHISPYSHGNYANHEPLRTRKLLLNRSEINRLIGRTTERGLTLVPLRMYLKDGRLKCELTLAK